MAISKLNGGLGNQMFQYAVACVIAKQNNTSLFIDDSFLKVSKTRDDVTSRDFELSVFNNDLSLNIFKNSNMLRKSVISNKENKKKPSTSFSYFSSSV